VSHEDSHEDHDKDEAMTKTTTKATTKTKGARTTTSTRVQAAAEEGLLDVRVGDMDPARWPSWARARYGVEHPAGEVVEPLTVDEAAR
jgi:hypothetical protein